MDYGVKGINFIKIFHKKCGLGPNQVCVKARLNSLDFWPKWIKWQFNTVMG